MRGAAATATTGRGRTLTRRRQAPSPPKGPFLPPSPCPRREVPPFPPPRVLAGGAAGGQRRSCGGPPLAAPRRRRHSTPPCQDPHAARATRRRARRLPYKTQRRARRHIYMKWGGPGDVPPPSPLPPSHEQSVPPDTETSGATRPVPLPTPPPCTVITQPYNIYTFSFRSVPTTLRFRGACRQGPRTLWSATRRMFHRR